MTGVSAGRLSEAGATLGVEEEYHLLDPVTYDLVNLPAWSATVTGPVQSEMLTSQLEAASPVCSDLAGLQTAAAGLVGRRQREVFAATNDLRTVVRDALVLTAGECDNLGVAR